MARNRIGQNKKKSHSESDMSKGSTLHPEAWPAFKTIQDHDAVNGTAAFPQPAGDGGFSISFKMKVPLPSRSVKAGNRKYLIGYIVANCLVFGWLSGAFSVNPESFDQFFDKVTNPLNAAGILLIPLSIVLEGLLSSDLKHKIVFFRIKHELPGCRAFTEMALNDHRIDRKKLSQLFLGGLPKNPQEQNSVWYGFYKKHSDKTIVVQSNRFFLLTRDLATLTLLLGPTSLLAYLIWGTPADKIFTHLGILTMIFVATAVAAQNYGNRLVTNVLTEDINQVVCNDIARRG
ncbi:MAG TPA: hypothetical protein PKM59_03375 [Thermodesulfobacteriota bacterium]|nr:hypothetical protein [Thermodesulfobacteriota bacterium]